MEVMKNKEVKELIDIVSKLNGAKQTKAFLRDLMTEKELLEFANRWKAARMLDSGETYQAIEAETGLSSRTIARISQWLNNGMNGYKEMINLHHNGDSSG